MICPLSLRTLAQCPDTPLKLVLREVRAGIPHQGTEGHSTGDFHGVPRRSRREGPRLATLRQGAGAGPATINGCCAGQRCRAGPR